MKNEEKQKKIMAKTYSILVLIMLSIFSVLALAEDQGLNKGIEISLIDLKLTPVEKAWLKDHQSIEIGGPKSFPPFHYFEEDGGLKGISADYINAIMNQLGVKVNVQNNLPWPEVLKRAESGKIDLIPCIAKTDEREKFLSFSSPYLSFPLVIINKKDMPFIGGVEDLAGKKLAVIRKISTIEWLKRDGINFIPYYVESPLKGLESVSFGKADAQIENLAVASYLIQKYGLTNLKIAAPTHYDKYNLYMAVRKDLPELLGIINKALDAISPEQHIQIRNKLLSVRYEHGIKKIEVFLWVIGITGVALLFIVFVLFWNKRLKREIVEKRKAEEINKALFAISSAVNTTQNLKDLFQSIHNSLGSIIDASNFFIAMVDIKERTLHFPYHVDTTDDDFSSITNFDNNDSLTGLVVSQRRPVLLKKQDLEKRAGQNGVWGPMPLIWMGVPLIVKDEVIGVVAVQSYLNSNLYKEQDLQVFSAVSDQMAIAIDRKRAEEALQESEKKYRHLFKNAPAGIYEIDFEKIRFINVNDIMCKYTGYSEKELLSMNPLDLLTEDSKSLYIKRLEKLSKKEKMAPNVEHDIIKKNGQKLNVILNNDFVYKNGKLMGARVVVHDITELKKAQEEKIKAQRFAGEQKKLALVGQVAGKMAHDFNNILGIIMGNTELSLMDCKDEETKKTLELIFEQTIRGKNLTRNLVAFAKDQEPRQEFFRISEKIDLVLSLLKNDLEGIELIKEYKPGVPELLADPGMIEHALVNLIQNSIHATSMNESPRIIVTTYSLDNRICLEIEDNGCGISKENLENIYEPSFTLKGSKDVTGSYKSDIKGTGYGMANVKKYVEQHKGSISIESEVGVGATVTICLPVIKKELTTEEKAELKKEITQFEKYILLVEDETAISDVQYRILTSEPCHHKVDVAHNGEMAKDLFERNIYDFVSLDYVLAGGINGMDVYHYIRKTNQTVPVLFISGNIEFLESIKEMKQRDAYIDHLSKPCQNKDYVNGINGLLEKTIAEQ
ncbi:transporter substrate-binding domain-containing protein [Desulfobacula sp.]|uniref:transporter substrate-binding domain-containing protein n=1 Tax=Desulfobacula sp. TaxID=2593537 RepID=UPI001EC5D982|nr:transporter substrate-binding domain-containing protein [Desulfobacula sp.]